MNLTLSNNQFEIKLTNTGAIRSLRYYNRELTKFSGDGTLFRLQLRDAAREVVTFTNLDFPTPEIVQEKRCGDSVLILSYHRAFDDSTLCVIVTIRLPEAGAMSYWRIRVEGVPQTHYCEWIDFPRIRVPNDLIGKGGNAQFFWPAYEGVLFHDLTFRETEKIFSSSIIEYPMTGVGGFYPGPCPMQFLAYCNPAGSLYMGCHDVTHSPKALDVCLDENNSLRPYIQWFTGSLCSAFVEIGGDIVVGGFDGDWQDACLLYRDWMETFDTSLPVKLENNTNVPAWLKDSPVILIYPVKGEGYDTGSLTGNEYFPYLNAMPMVESYASQWQTPIMSLLMHWEGTAPWAPPYVWPPYGGSEMLRQFADALHAKGHLLGVYCSGISWTQTSSIDPSYSRAEQFAKENLTDEMCRGPQHEMFARICNGKPGEGQRIGYEMCPSREWTVQTVCSEIESIIGADVDYLQYFDQNQGCAAPLCYAQQHGHPASPGPWSTRAMMQLLNRCENVIRRAGKTTVLGCENAAAQPYIRNLQLNDLRNHLAWRIGQPVPAYSLIFHEYINSFTGNGVCLASWFDREKCPQFIHYRTAYSFISGEILSAVMKGGGEMHWSWVCKWDEPGPEQSSLKTLIGNLNHWRRGRARQFLVFGRMEKNLCVESTTWTLFFSGNQTPLALPNVVSSRWTYQQKEMEILANFNVTPEIATVHFGRKRQGKWYDNYAKESEGKTFTGESLTLEISPLSVVLIEFSYFAI